MSNESERPRLGPKELRISVPAQDDIREVDAYLHQRHGEPVAATFLRRLDADLKSLAASGHSGASRDELRPGLRLHVFERFSIYFRLTDEVITVVRILRGSRDLKNINFASDGE
jgi:toxin ParE1/3/4